MVGPLNATETLASYREVGQLDSPVELLGELPESGPVFSVNL